METMNTAYSQVYLGSINKVIDSDNDILKIGATILSKYAPDIKKCWTLS